MYVELNVVWSVVAAEVARFGRSGQRGMTWTVCVSRGIRMEACQPAERKVSEGWWG